ncbi:hypothetical protein GCM10010423_69020 [Streptomyces levis]|uniref:Integral membrane protein n=2 Tax=Streptomyces levis TaxID=285566 RepID=A0ABN3P439_9ACTN
MGATAVIAARTTATAVTLAALTAFVSALSGYISATLLATYRVSVEQARFYFREPFTGGYLLAAEHLAKRLDPQNTLKHSDASWTASYNPPPSRPNPRQNNSSNNNRPRPDTPGRRPSLPQPAPGTYGPRTAATPLETGGSATTGPAAVSAAEATVASEAVRGARLRVRPGERGAPSPSTEQVPLTPAASTMLLMADLLYPLAPDEDLPELGTYNAIGTMLLHNSRADESRGFFATCWFMVILPVVPLGRYYVRVTGYGNESGLFFTSTSTSYQIVGRSRIRWTEVVRTYLAAWIVLPAAFVGPIIAAVVGWGDESATNAGLYGMLVSLGLLALLLTVFFCYRQLWRAVREVRWADTPMGRRDGRSWQEVASMLQMAVLMGLLGFFAGVVILFTALAMGELPTRLDPKPNPYADTLLSPVTLLAGLPVATGMVTLAVLAGRRR